MNNKRISIIIPIFNTEQYLERCIRSVLNQSYTNLEIICVDDGSTDNSGKILDRLAQEDVRLIVYHKENAGVVNARNFGLEKATGQYIGFVDSDDYVDKDMFLTLVKAMDKNDVDIVTCSYYFDFNGKIERAQNKKQVHTKITNTRDFLQYIYERDTYVGVGSYLWTRLFKTELIKCYRFNNEYEGFDDIVFLAEIMVKNKKMLYIDQPMYFYFQREKSIVHDYKKQLETLNWVKAYEKIINIYEQQNINIDVMNIIKRMYVYRCGKTLEVAYKVNDVSKIRILKQKIEDNLSAYIETNQQYPERIEWIKSLMY